MNIQIAPVSLEGSALCSAYLAGDRHVCSLYLAGPPGETGSYQQVAERIRSTSPEALWKTLGESLSSANAGVEKRLAEVMKHRGLFVATGQQAGLFVSPLYTLYKALTAARLARRLEEELNLPVMPLFSVASEDHDWDEVNHTYVVDLKNQVVRLSVSHPGSEVPDGARPSVERITLGDEVEKALDELVQSTPDTEFKAIVLGPLREAYRPGRRFAAAFESALSHLLRRHAFLLVRTAHPYVKQTTRQLLWAEWERRRESETQLVERERQLVEAGLEPQVPLAPGATNLFFEGRLGRDRILADNSSARLRRSDERFSESELRRVLDEQPGRVSPGVLLRPVTEARAFPVVATVGGPSEIAYLAQSQALFALHEVVAPVVVPRAAFQLVEPKISKVLEKYELQLDDLAGDPAASISRLIKGRTPPELQESLDALRRAVASALSQVEDTALEFDPGARSALGSGKRAIFESLASLESKLQGRVREKHQVMQHQLEKIAANLFPNGRPQERILNPYPFLIRYGEGLLDAIYDRVVTPLD